MKKTKNPKTQPQMWGDKRILAVYPIPEEVNAVFREADALRDLRDSLAKYAIIGGYRMAKKAAFEAEKLKEKGWHMAMNIHPELKKEFMKGHELTTNVLLSAVYVLEKETSHA